MYNRWGGWRQHRRSHGSARVVDTRSAVYIVLPQLAADASDVFSGVRTRGVVPGLDVHDDHGLSELGLRRAARLGLLDDALLLVRRFLLLRRHLPEKVHVLRATRRQLPHPVYEPATGRMFNLLSARAGLGAHFIIVRVVIIVVVRSGGLARRGWGCSWSRRLAGLPRDLHARARARETTAGRAGSGPACTICNYACLSNMLSQMWCGSGRSPDAQKRFDVLVPPSCMRRGAGIRRVSER